MRWELAHRVDPDQATTFVTVDHDTSEGAIEALRATLDPEQKILDVRRLEQTDATSS